MSTREILKKEIDILPDNMIDELYSYLHREAVNVKEKKKIRSFKLNGQFDNINIRKQAYEQSPD